MSREVLRYNWQSEEQTQRTICKKLHCKYHCTLTMYIRLNHCFWKLRFWAPTVTYGNEKPEGGDEQLNNTLRRSVSVGGTPTKLPISFSLLNTWLADSEHELVSILSLLQKSFSLDELLFRLRCTTTNLSIFPRTLLAITVPEIRTTGRTTPIVTHCATRAEFVRHGMYEAVSLNAIMTHDSQRLYRKATFSEGFL